MAQTKERTQPAAKAPPKATQRTTSPASKAPTPTAPAPWRNWLTRLRPPLTNAPTTNAPTTDGKPRQRAGGTLFKSFFGVIVWFIASQLIMYGLLLLDGVLKKPGGLPPLEATHLFPPNTPLLGGVTPFLALYGVAVIGLWFLLIRLGLIPRDFFNARAQAQARANRQAGATAATSTGATTGPKKTRTQRRHAEIQAQTNAKGNGKTTAKGAAKPVAKPVAKPMAKVSDSQKVAVTSSGGHDQEYDQVRAAERQRRRRVSKR